MASLPIYMKTKKPGRIGDLAEHASMAISSGSGRVYKGLQQAR